MNLGPLNLDVFNSEITQPTSPPPTIEAPRDAQFIGRYQIGDSVSLEFKTVGASAFATIGAVKPDTVPAVRIYSPSASTKGFSIPVDTTNLSAKGIFKGSFTPGALDVAAHCFALFAYSVSGKPKAALSPFEILAGGHRNGPIISSYYFSQPSGNIFIAHEESGVVTQGLRPYLDTGD